MKPLSLIMLASMMACKDTRVTEMKETISELKAQIEQTRTFVGIEDSTAAKTAENEETKPADSPTAKTEPSTANGTQTATSQPAATEETPLSLSTKIKKLETELATLKQQLGARSNPRQRTATPTKGATGARQNPNQKPSKAQEAQAQRLLKEITNLMSKNQFGPAKQKLQLMKTRLSNTVTYKKAQASVLKELALIGRPSPKNIESKQWFGKKETIDLTKGVTVIFFWEVWCPECITELPKLNTIFTTLRKQGLKAVTLSRLTRNSTEKQLKGFLKKNKIKIPAALDDGRYSQYFKVSGIPAAAIVKDGKIVWRGHPKSLSVTQMSSFLK